MYLNIDRKYLDLKKPKGRNVKNVWSAMSLRGLR